jgi:hypothetical protein
MRSAILTLCVIALAACTEQKVAGPTPSVTGVTKRDTQDENPRTMWAGAATPVTVTGERFVPMAGDTLLTKWFVKVPRLFLVNATSTTELTDIKWLDRQTIEAEIPDGITLGDKPGWEDFQVVAEDPSGKRSEPGGAFRVSNLKPPVITGALIGGAKPVARFCDIFTASNTVFNLTLQGTDFAPGVTANYALVLTAGTASPATMAVMAVAATGVTVLVPAGLTAGVYDVRLTNVDGQRMTFADAFTVEFYTCPPPDYAIHAVTPRFAYRGDNVMLQVDGERFDPTPSITLRRSGYAVNVSYEAFLTDTTIQGLLYADMNRQVGWYALEVTNPGDVTGVTLAHALLVVDSPLPKIDSVSPDSLPGVDKLITVTGKNFCDNACVFPANTTVAAFDVGGYAAGITSQTMSDTKINVFFPGSATSGVFVLRVFKNITVAGNPEKVWSDYSNIVVTSNPSGNTAPFQTSSSRLITARREFGLVGARNSVGSRFLYAIGGRSSHTDNTSALASIDIAPIDVFGHLLSFYQNPITFGSTGPRFASGVVEYAGWVYVVGGWRPSAGPTTEVLKAKVLDPAEAPVIIDVSATTGTLGAGNWLYVVSAVKANTDVSNPGETLPSVEVSQELSATGGVRIRWKSVTGALNYHVYRSDTTASVPQSEHLIASTSGACVSGICSYTDAGDPAGTVGFLPQGALSSWSNAGTLNTARSNLVATVARNRLGQPFIYALGGVDTIAGNPIATYEYAAVTTGGNLTFLPGTRSMSTPRRDAMVAVGDLVQLTATQITSATLGTLKSDWVSVLSGAASNFGSFQSTADNAQVQDSGALGGFSTYSKSLSTVGGGGAILAAQTLFEMGGTNSSYDGTGSQNTVTSGLFVAFKTNPQPQLALQSFNANPNGLLAPRSFFGYTRFNAQIFIVGGTWINPTSSALEVTDTIETVYY